jgi:PIN domain nuclease of toxin-antitoxin system
VILLDTHAWIWWAAQSPKLGRRARSRIESAERIGVAAVSVWEVAMLVAKRRIEFDRPTLTWVRQALLLPRIELLALTPEVSIRAAELGPAFPGDPADRMIVATAIEARAALLTRDRRLRLSELVDTVW